MESDTFASRLVRARKRRGLTQVQLARAAGLAADVMVSRYERGEHTPHAATMGALADALRVPMDWLARGQGPEPRWGKAA
jgi:transcriptional regulator with XRE-family HTH domain